MWTLFCKFKSSSGLSVNWVNVTRRNGVNACEPSQNKIGSSVSLRLPCNATTLNSHTENYKENSSHFVLWVYENKEEIISGSQFFFFGTKRDRRAGGRFFGMICQTQIKKGALFSFLISPWLQNAKSAPKRPL